MKNGVPEWSQAVSCPCFNKATLSVILLARDLTFQSTDETTQIVSSHYLHAFSKY